MRFNYLFFSAFFLTQLFCVAQEAIPKDYFVNPLDIPIVLSGTFGELRSNHFHSGLDIKTQRKIGIPVYAAAAGTVTRIKISHYGYGKALYITHPNGYNTVYAHLQKFCPEIEEYIKKAQYRKESYEIELFPKDGELSVAQGEIVAYSGNTGSSGGPHLHFEIRDKNSRPMNPFLFGIEVKDSRLPILSRVKAYPLDANSYINGSASPVELRIIQNKDGSFTTEKVKGFGKIGFGVSAIDQQDYANNKNGIYEIRTALNGTTNFEVRMDKFSFAETRYLNRMIDYGYYKKRKGRIQKLFVEKNNPLSIYGKLYDNGIIQVEDSLSYQYFINIRDYAGNNIDLTVAITGQKDTLVTPVKIKETDHYVYSDQGYSFSEGKFSVYIPKDALYDDAFLDLKVEGDKLTLHRDELPVHKNISITYDLSEYKEDDRDKLYLGRLNYKDDVYYSSTKIIDGTLKIGTRTLGAYALAKDTTPPVITPINVKNNKWMSKYRYLKFEIKDHQSGIKGYRATVNGKFILMEYDYKTNLLIHDFNDQAVTNTENILKLIVTDNVGNSTTFETTFFRKDLR